MPAPAHPGASLPPCPRRISILGSTGSIGKQALEVVAAHPERFQVVALTAHSSVAALAEQALAYRPAHVAIGDESKYAELRRLLADTPIAVHAGPEALCAAAALPEADVVLTALVGFAGLAPTLAALAAGKPIALANKETLVVGGELVMAAAAAAGVPILPVDSEHSALFQCLVGEAPGSVHRLILTASGGPFRGYGAEALRAVTLEQALRHPNWAMGAKITIDSASMMNKGLEVIEARWLFGVPAERIDVLVHPQSIVHSLVEFADGSLKAQLGTPDMRLPIQYALAYPERLAAPWPRLDWARYPQLTFEAPDRGVFRALGLAYEALAEGGCAPCVLNAANEVAVAGFLGKRLGFTQIYDSLEYALERAPRHGAPTLEALLETDRATRALVQARIGQHA